MKISVNLTVDYDPGDDTKTKRAKEVEISKALKEIITDSALASMPGCYLKIDNVGKVTLPGYHPRTLIK